MHITASVFINDDESGLHQDYERWLEQLAPHEPASQYRHNRTGEDNADAYIMPQVLALGEVPGDGPRGGGGDHGWQAGLRPTPLLPDKRSSPCATRDGRNPYRSIITFIYLPPEDSIAS
jgi:hypothetical protein